MPEATSGNYDEKGPDEWIGDISHVNEGIRVKKDVSAISNFVLHLREMHIHGDREKDPVLIQRKLFPELDWRRIKPGLLVRALITEQADAENPQDPDSFTVDSIEILSDEEAKKIREHQEHMIWPPSDSDSDDV